MANLKEKKPQLKNLDALFGLEETTNANDKPIQEIPIDNLTPFARHPFRLYEGERLDDMVESIKTNGVLVPVIARNKQGNDEALEILAGHNRINAAKIANRATVPTIVLNNISDEEAMVYVVETNLMQRSFSDMKHSEKAAVIAMHHNKMFSQGKRNDILEQLKILENPAVKTEKYEIDNDSKTSSQCGTKLETGRADEKVGAMYSLSRNTIARYLRINQLNSFLKAILDNGKLPFLAAVDISFLNEEEQEWLELLNSVLGESFSININKANQLRNISKNGELDKITMQNIITGKAADNHRTVKSQKIKVSGEIYSKYFKPEQTAKEVESIIEES